MESQIAFAFIFIGIGMAALVGVLFMDLDDKSDEIKQLKTQIKNMTELRSGETVKIEYFVVAIELSEHSINEISHRKATEDRLIRDLAKELSERSIVRFRCNWYRDRNAVKVEAHLRALPADWKKEGKSYIYKPLHSEII